jgi:serine/threonine protein phosphatase PrpC/CRP-like cAMP-binding protein
LFSVYDGHGRYGDQCAQFARDHLPNLISRHVQKAKREKSSKHGSKPEAIELNKENTQNACAAAHKQCNLEMHTNQNLDDALSGTTAISCYVHGRRNRMTVCNVGDSRAVLGQRVHRESNLNTNGTTNSSNSRRDNGRSKSSPEGEAFYRALPLSRDQTPYRRDERKRIRTYGARILSLDQIEGLEPVSLDDSDDENGRDEIDLGKEIDEGGDPPRVWHPEQDYPGTAFTRSLGDALAEELGVYAEPEMVTRELEDGDEIIVLASDGVFEFLTNQSVIDICAKFKDPLAACKAVVAESYELWLQYELRTDDITMICIFIDSKDKPTQRGSISSVASNGNSGPNNGNNDVFSDNQEHDLAEVETEDVDDDDRPDILKHHERESRPVRSRPTVEKSKLLRKMSSMTLESTTDDAHFDMTKFYTKKTEEEKACISQAIKASVMLESMTENQRDMIYGVMEPVEVKKGDWIIRQGTVGDRFYIVEEGVFEVRIVPDGQANRFKNGGNVVHEYEGSKENHQHPSFGELALLYSVPRAASIVAKTNGKLWALHKSALKKVLVEQSGRQELLKVLRTVKILEKFKDEEIGYIAGMMELETFPAGHQITKKGARGSTLYAISTGQCGKFHSIRYIYIYICIEQLVRNFWSFLTHSLFQFSPFRNKHRYSRRSQG